MCSSPRTKDADLWKACCLSPGRRKRKHKKPETYPRHDHDCFKISQHSKHVFYPLMCCLRSKPRPGIYVRDHAAHPLRPPRPLLHLYIQRNPRRSRALAGRPSVTRPKLLADSDHDHGSSCQNPENKIGIKFNAWFPRAAGEAKATKSTNVWFVGMILFVLNNRGWRLMETTSL